MLTLFNTYRMCYKLCMRSATRILLQVCVLLMITMSRFMQQLLFEK